MYPDWGAELIGLNPPGGTSSACGPAGPGADPPGVTAPAGPATIRAPVPAATPKPANTLRRLTLDACAFMAT
ncbi:MAG: hypothetical protein ACR2KJ_09890 [Jatrophihabitans sp.]